jgi:hypothetical protein
MRCGRCTSATTTLAARTRFMPCSVGCALSSQALRHLASMMMTWRSSRSSSWSGVCASCDGNSTTALPGSSCGSWPSLWGAGVPAATHSSDHQRRRHWCRGGGHRAATAPPAHPPRHRTHLPANPPVHVHVLWAQHGRVCARCLARLLSGQDVHLEGQLNGRRGREGEAAVVAEEQARAAAAGRRAQTQHTHTHTHTNARQHPKSLRACTCTRNCAVDACHMRQASAPFGARLPLALLQGLK